MIPSWLKRAFTASLLLLSVTSPLAADAFESPPRGRPPPPLVVRGSKFVRQSDGVQVRFHGYNYFGFNNGQTWVDGSWAGGSAAGTDFRHIVYQVRALGFNAVRLPFIFRDLFDMRPLNRAVPCSAASVSDMRRRTLDPQVSSNRTFPPFFVPVPGPVNGQCTTYIPNTSTMDRFLWAVQKFVSEGQYVLLDYHPMFVEKTAWNADEFVAGWRRVWQAVLRLPNFDSDLRGRVFIDVLNEPDSIGLRWEPSAGRPGVRDLYIRTMDALEALRPGLPVFFVEGAGQTGFQVNWGDGFVTDPALISRFGLSDPNPFFRDLLRKPYRSRTVISPHVYGPTVTRATSHYEGTQLWDRLDRSYGYLSRRGYCHNGVCQVFPVVIGEFGSFFRDPRDIRHLTDLALHARNSGGARRGNHWSYAGYFYWCYNANSGDTGGLVDDTWQRLEWTKLRFLVRNLWLRPWYL